MCGLITIYNPSQNVDTNSLVELYIDQKHRGQDGFGFSYITPSGVVKTLRFTDEAEVFFALSKVKSKLIQFHHRIPTSTQNTAFQNHPICSNKIHEKSYSFTHNGMISNHALLKKNHDTEGINYVTKGTSGNFNDSEALLHDLAFHIEEDSETLARGSIAFVMLQIDKRSGKIENLMFGRNDGNPLHHWTYGEDQVISSERPRYIADNDKDVLDDLTNEIPPFELNTIQWSKGKFKPVVTKLPLKKEKWETTTYHQSGYHGYGHDYDSFDCEEDYEPKAKKKKEVTLLPSEAKDRQAEISYLYDQVKYIIDSVEYFVDDAEYDIDEAIRLQGDIDSLLRDLDKVATKRSRKYTKKLSIARLELLTWSEIAAGTIEEPEPMDREEAEAMANCGLQSAWQGRY